MRALNACFGHLVAAGAGDVDEELVFVFFFQLDVDAVFGNHFFALLHTLRRATFEHFQLFFAVADKYAQGNGDRQANHPRAGDAHAHRVFKYVGTQSHVNSFGRLCQKFLSLRRA